MTAKVSDVSDPKPSTGGGVGFPRPRKLHWTEQRLNAAIRCPDYETLIWDYTTQMASHLDFDPHGDARLHSSVGASGRAPDA